jgi:proliferating cell nuclear antigen
MSEKLFEIKTLKGIIIKNLIEVVKQYIKETNLYISSEGIKISSIESSKNSFTFIKLDANKFESFVCPTLQVVGINIEHLYKCIKHCDRKDIISLYISKDNEEYLTLEISDPFVGKTKIYNIQRLTLDNTDIKNIDDIQFDYVVNIPTSQFQKVIKDMSILGGKIVDIKSVNKQLLFTCDDGLAKFTTRLNDINDDDTEYEIGIKDDKEKCIVFEQANNSIVQGKFKLVCLMDFIKASQLCDNMNLLLANDKPLILEYSIADLGVLRLVLIQCN